MNDNVHPSEKIRAEIDNVTDIEALDRKIKDAEVLLLQAENNRMTGWIPLVISIGLVIYMGIKIPLNGAYAVITGLGLLYLGINIWRIVRHEKQKKEIEAELKAIRDRKAELQSLLAGK